jgi:hypothetical protein
VRTTEDHWRGPDYHRSQSWMRRLRLRPSPRLSARLSLSAGQQAVNRSHAKVRALVEHAITTLKSWRLPRKLRCTTTRIRSLIQAVRTLPLVL